MINENIIKKFIKDKQQYRNFRLNITPIVRIRFGENEQSTEDKQTPEDFQIFANILQEKKYIKELEVNFLDPYPVENIRKCCEILIKQLLTSTTLTLEKLTLHFDPDMKDANEKISDVVILLAKTPSKLKELSLGYLDELSKEGWEVLAELKEYHSELHSFQLVSVWAMTEDTLDPCITALQNFLSKLTSVHFNNFYPDFRPDPIEIPFAQKISDIFKNQELTVENFYLYTDGFTSDGDTILEQGLRFNSSVLTTEKDGVGIKYIQRNNDLKQKRQSNPNYNFLHHAAFLGDTELVKHLITVRQFNMDELCSAGHTPLHYAAHSDNVNNFSTVASLLDLKANPAKIDLTSFSKLLKENGYDLKDLKDRGAIFNHSNSLFFEPLNSGKRKNAEPKNPTKHAKITNEKQEIKEDTNNSPAQLQ